MTDQNLAEKVVEATSIDAATEQLTKSILTSAHDNIPKKKIKIDPTKPWFRKSLLQLIRRKHAAQAAADKSPNDINKARRARNMKKRVEKDVKQAIISYYSELFRNCASPKQFWENIRKVTKGPRSVSIPTLITTDGTVILDDEGKANAIADSLDTKWNRLDGPSPVIQPTTELEPEWLCEPDFVQVQIKNIPLSKAPGADGIPIRLLKEAEETLGSAICALINRCINQYLFIAIKTT